MPLSLVLEATCGCGGSEHFRSACLGGGEGGCATRARLHEALPRGVVSHNLRRGLQARDPALGRELRHAPGKVFALYRCVLAPPNGAQTTPSASRASHAPAGGTTWPVLPARCLCGCSSQTRTPPPRPSRTAGASWRWASACACQTDGRLTLCASEARMREGERACVRRDAWHTPPGTRSSRRGWPRSP